MSDRALRKIAWTVWAALLLLLLGHLVVDAVARLAGQLPPPAAAEVTTSLVAAAIIIGVPTLGVFVVSRHPRNLIGWIFLAVGLLIEVNGIADSYAHHADPASTGAAVAAWLANLTQGAAIIGIFIFVFLLFPTGRLLSARWRPVAWAAAGVVIFLALGDMLRPGPIDNYRWARNPFGVGGLGPALAVTDRIAYVSSGLALLVAAVSLVLRFRRSRGDERQQLKWVAAATALAAILIPGAQMVWQLFPAGFAWLGGVAFVTAVLSIPLAVAVAMLKYRLYDIDLIINRALVYGSVTVSLAAVYIGGVVSLQALFRLVSGQSSDLAIAISTLAIAALFQPLRRHIQEGIDRRFYRRKYDASRTLAAFQSKLRDEVDLDHLTTDLIAVVEETMQPIRVSVWLRQEKTRPSQ